jgi:hypothetical protein
MSHLDQHFAATASRGLSVYPTPVPGESTLEPGFLYPVEGSDATAIFGIAQRPLSEVSGKRLALVIITPPPDGGTPGAIHMSPPDGQRIEGDDGYIPEAGNVDAGVQELGAYREWVCDPDGTWLMVGHELGEGVSVALGQIVVQGVPIVVQGVPLVLTPPVTFAHSVRIVPRAPTLPAPRVGTVELVDTFADASLEMDAEGDQFRVAAVLQSAIEDAQADIIAIDTDLAALEVEVGAMRFPFTLRVTSVSSTDYEEIGVQRFDPTDLAGRGLRLVAELDVAAFGQVAELQLVDLTDGTEVAMLSTNKTATTLCSAALVLPSAVTLYSVRLRRVGGNASLRVACRSVALELTDA